MLEKLRIDRGGAGVITGHIVNEHSPVEDMIKRYNDAIKSLNDFDKRLGDGENADKKQSLMTSKDFWF